MAIPAELARFQNEPGIRSYARALRMVKKELARAQSTITSVDVLSRKDGKTGWKRFFALEKAGDADHWVSIVAVVEGRHVRLELPFRRGLHLPYSLELELDAKLEFTASLRRNLLRGASWVVEPDTLPNREVARKLNAVPVPGVGWRHESGGIPILLSEGGRLLPVTSGGVTRAVWRVFSAYQGFVFNVRPQVVKYVRAAPSLELFLRTLTV